MVNFVSAAECKKCGTELAPQVPADGPEGDGSINGLPDWVRVTLMLVTACVVCTLGIFWIKSLMLDGSYPVIFFLPFAFAGWIVGLIVTGLINAVYKGLRPAR